MAVAAHDDVDRRPAGADAANDMAQYSTTSAPSGVLPGRRITATGLPLLAS
jgi:hypothetical protein